MKVMTSDLAFASAAELLAGYRRKTLSPVDATKAALERIEKINPKLNAFCLIDADGALAAARESEARWMKGTPRGMLDGVTATVKDLILARGWPTLRGSKLVSRNQNWDADAPAVARLRGAGCVLLGKTTTPEFGWKALGDSPLTGITRNPWDPSRTPGGSSAGAAVAAAAGMGCLHIGTDGGGSIRIPSAFSGNFGLKPSFGRVPAYPPSYFGLVSHVGPMTRTVGDAALMLTAMAGHEDRDPYSLPSDGRDYTVGIEGGVRGLKIAYSPTLGYAQLNPEVRAATDRAAQMFAELGAIVEPAEPGFVSPFGAFWTLWTTGAAKLVSTLPADRLGELDPGLREAAEDGARRSARDWLDADAVRADLGQKMAAFHRRYDLLLTPSVAVPALPVSQDLNEPERESEWIDWTPFSYPFNMTRQPAASIACGLTSAGLPIGLQIVGALFDDATVMRAARAFEAAQPFVRPPV
ncbi:MAG TPA: amidase [Alphaproteobacteria bacterium]|nr:amidase [Alphaproteobacteria bacterium]